MKILVVHQYYLFPGQPGGSRFNEMTRLWIAAGHEVTVIAGTLNYATGARHPELGRRWATRVKEQGATVWRCYVPATYNASFFGRAWAFFGFVLSSSWAALRTERPDIVIASSPPLTTVITGWVAARMRRRAVPWIFEMRDLWPESAVTTGVLSPEGILTRLLYGLERWAAGSATAINVLTPAFRDDIIRRGLAPAEKICFVPNGADVSAFADAGEPAVQRRALQWGSQIVALYAGAHGRANALGQLLDAAEHLRDRDDILIASVGDGPERELLETEAKRRRLTNIVFHGAQPKERMPAIVRAADIGLAVLQDNSTFRTVYPNKVFDYMTCERPTVLAIDGVARQLVCEDAGAGLFAQPEDGAAIAAAIRQLADSPTDRVELGRSGRRWVMAHATREALATRYLEHMQSLVAGVSSRRQARPAETGA